MALQENVLQVNHFIYMYQCKVRWNNVTVWFFIHILSSTNSTKRHQSKLPYPTKDMHTYKREHLSHSDGNHHEDPPTTTLTYKTFLISKHATTCNNCKFLSLEQTYKRGNNVSKTKKKSFMHIIILNTQIPKKSTITVCTVCV